MKRRAMIGTPISKGQQINELEGHGFCISYYNRQKVGWEIDRLIELVGQDQMLMLDNGAFTLHCNGGSMDDRYLVDYALWANDLLGRCPQAVWVMPDVIGGGWDENIELEDRFAFLCEQFNIKLPMERCMVLWHLHEPLERLGVLIDSGLNFLGLGSSGQYWKPGTKDWKARMQEAFDYIDEHCAAMDVVRPWTHLMRAQAQAPEYPVESSDSTNASANAHRHKERLGQGYVGKFAQEVTSKSLVNQFGVDRPYVCQPVEAARVADKIAFNKDQDRRYRQACREFEAVESEWNCLEDMVEAKALEAVQGGASKEEVHAFFCEFGCDYAFADFLWDNKLFNAPMSTDAYFQMVQQAKEREKALRAQRKANQQRTNESNLPLFA